MPADRLQKIIAAAGITSRRKAESLITAGKVTVNGEVIRQLGSKADAARDHIKVKGKLLQRFPGKVYLVLNKPRGTICSVSDPKNRSTVLDLVKPYRGLYPVGRLDYNTEGLLLLTNDGDFARAVSRAGSRCPKTYEVKVRGIPSPERLERLRQGIRLPTGTRLAPVTVIALKRERAEKNSWFQVRLHEGRKNQIRIMFDMIGHAVVKLRRTAIGFLQENRLPSGAYRSLTEGEVKQFLRLGEGPPPHTFRDSPQKKRFFRATPIP